MIAYLITRSALRTAKRIKGLIAAARNIFMEPPLSFLIGFLRASQVEDKNHGYQGEERRDLHWKITREISVGNILTMISLAGVIIGAGISFDRRLTTLEAHEAQQMRTDAQQDISIKEGLARIEGSLADIQRYLRDHNSAPGKP